MGQICDLICKCFSRRRERVRDDITPSHIPDNELTEEFKVPYNKFGDLFKQRGYDYNRRKKLAQGGSAIVYEISKFGEKTTFALKEIDLKGTDAIRDKKKFKNLKNEIFVISKIRHKHIVVLFDHFIINNTCYLVMEFANNGTVQDLINKSGPMPQMTAKPYFIQICRAIEHLHLHSPPIAHNDLKLANILIHIQNGQKILKVTDFGFSKVMNEKADKKLFRARVAEGTGPFMSPQMILLILYQNNTSHTIKEKMKQKGLKPRTVNPIKADIWSLGVCLYVMVSGKLPFIIPDEKYEKYDNFLDVAEQQISGKRQPIDQKISLQLNHLLDQMLEPKTNIRINISDVIKHQWLTGVNPVIKIK